MTTLPPASSERKALDSDPAGGAGTRTERFAFYYFMGAVVLSVLVMVLFALTI